MITTQTKNDIDTIQECIKVCDSFEYFLDEYVYIEDKKSGDAIRFKLWPGQKRILPILLIARLIISIKARQLGITWLIAAYVLWLSITHMMHLAVVISAKEEWAVEFLDRVRFMRDRLPIWLYPKCSKDSTQHMQFEYGPTCKGETAEYSDIKSLATTIEGAQSKTPNVLVMDETSRNRYARQIFGSSKPGIDKAGGQIIIISNSHKDGTGWSWTRGIYIGAMKALNGFHRIFMSWRDCPERPDNFKEIQLSEGMDEQDFSEQYPETEEEAISVAGGSFFRGVLDRHKSFILGAKGVIKKFDKNNQTVYEFREESRGILEIWRYPYRLTQQVNEKWTNRYCIGSDISEGLGRSYSVAYVMDRLTHDIVARLRSNRVDAYTWADMLYELSQYYENALINPESTGAGQTTIKRLHDLNANLYLRVVEDKVGKQVTQKIGWHESRESKQILCGELKQWLRVTDGFVFCELLIDECSTYIKHENGELKPEEGHFGDCVIAAGCTILANIFIDKPPERVTSEITGWLKDYRREKSSTWVN